MSRRAAQPASRPGSFARGLLALLLAGAIVALPCQAQRQDKAAPPRGRADTLLSELTGVPGSPGAVLRATIVRRYLRGTGADSGLLVRQSDFVQPDAAGGGVRVSERAAVDTATGAFRRGATRITRLTGELVRDTRTEVAGGRIRQVATTAQRTDTTWSAGPPAGQVLYAVFDDVLRRLPAEPAGQMAFEVLAPAPPFFQRLVIDSLLPAEAGGQRHVFGHIEQAGTRISSMHATVDTASRGVERLEWRLPNGIVNTVTRRTGPPATGTPDTGAPVEPGELRRLAGRYRLEGEREVASEILLRPDGRFSYGLAYGAVDESAAGRWTVRDGAVVLQSDGDPQPPSVTLQSATGAPTDSVVIVVVDTAGTPVHGIEVDVVRPRSGTSFTLARQGRHVVTFAKGDAPTEISIGYDVLGFMVAFPLEGKPRATYRFVFDRGDLGRHRFEGARLETATNQLILTRNGRRLHYVRR
ncbi:MAG: hypothetical protein IT355_09165 [Gemmatimonadaceae bacterium]|nr:hypothetical protein [Gemmatimonadaceae bacterium]